MGVQASIKQLAYEALTIAVAAIKQRVETPDEAAKKLPPQEKDQTSVVSTSLVIVS